MRDENKTKSQLIQELIHLRQRTAELEAALADRRQVEESLRRKRDFAQSLIETARVIILVLDTEGRIVRFNPYMEELSGYRLEEVQGQDWFTTFLPERDRERIRNLFLQAINSIQTRGNINPIVTKAGDEREIEWYDTTLKDAEGNIMSLLSIGHDITERLQAHKSLQETEEQFRQLAENIREFFWLFSPHNMEIIYASPTYEQIWGRTRQSLYEHSRSWCDAIHPKDRQRVFEALDLENQMQGRYDIEYRIVRPDGSIRWIRDRAFPIRNDRGEVYRLAGIAEDITEAKLVEQTLAQTQAELEQRIAERTAELESANTKLHQQIIQRQQIEKTLQESERLFRNLAETTNAAIFIHQDGVTCYANPAAEILAGYTLAELQTMNFWDTIHPGFRQLIRNQGLARQRGEEIPSSYELKILTKNGQERWIDCTVTLTKFKGKFATLATAFDITERKQAERMLRLQAQTIDQIQDAVISTDLDGFVTSWNKGAERRFGYLAKEALGRHISFIYPEEEHEFVQHQVIAPLKKKGEHEVEVRVRRKSGQVFYIHLSLSLLRDEGGMVTGMVSYSLDITERKQVEQALRQSEKRFKAQYESFPLPSYIWQRVEDDFVLIDYNYAAEIITRGNLVNFLGSKLSQMYQDMPDVQADFWQCFTEKRPVSREMLYRFRTTGENKNLAVTYAFVPPDLVMVHTEDITERKRAEEQIKALLNEKEILLQEIHHRVKNNLQVVSSLLKFQARYTNDPYLLTLLQDSQNRLKAMALIHEKLYQTQDLANINFARYVRSLITQLSHSFAAQSRGIRVTIDIKDDILLNLDAGLPCGLIINELVSNALKHAFPLETVNRNGEIYIGLQADKPHRLTLIISDNGVGFSQAVDWNHHTESSGLQLVRMLVEQLQGVIALEQDQGATFKITFPAR